ncbi:hypothetical protein C1881_05930 [Slackia isoflavoniconvertens]|uniref:Uncharacterized protein n=1 Tax=Slackia isoflavoniconvertens TaxID=572010 RepID=A0A369LJL9_9ACTN|nr:hypothetical protein C1881_05930 [Slackia isoflavoniconvertens]
MKSGFSVAINAVPSKRWFAESLCDYTPHWALPSRLKKERTNGPGARFLRIASLSKKRDSKTALLYA